MPDPAHAFPTFLRHRYRAHVQGWLWVAVVLLTAYYVDLYIHEPLWALLPASFIAAFFVVSLFVLVAALLRFPWWFLAPLTALSMAFEWLLRQAFNHPWRRTIQPRSRALSNPFAVWRRRKLKRRRQQRQMLPLPRPRSASVVPFPKRAQVHRAGIEWDGLFDFVVDLWESHFVFWIFVIPVALILWLWIGEDLGFFVALIFALLLTVIFTLMPAIPLAAALLGFLSAFLVGAGLTKRERQTALERLWAHRASAPAANPPAAAPTPSPPATNNRWLLPLLLGLLIGNAWGDEP